MSQLDDSYALALLDLAATGKIAAEQLRGELAQIGALLAESPALGSALANPAVPAAEKSQVLRTLAERLGWSRITRNFLGVVVARGRGGRLGAILAAFARLWRQRAGVAAADVVSARPLAAAERAAIEAALARAVGAQIEASYREDESLIAGFRARVGDRVFDGSLRGRLDRVRRRLMTA